MYILEHFKENDLQSLHRAIKEIQIAHVITLHQRRIEESKNTLYGYIAKANTQWKKPLTNPEALTTFTSAHHITPS